MTSIISPCSAISALHFSLAVILSLFACLQLSSLVPASFFLPFYNFFSIPLSFPFDPFPFIQLLQLKCLFCISLTNPGLPLTSCSPNPFKTVFSSPPLCSILPPLPGAPLPLCCPCMFRFSSLVTAFRLVLKALRQDPAHRRPSVSRSDRAVTLAVPLALAQSSVWLW